MLPNYDTSHLNCPEGIVCSSSGNSQMSIPPCHHKGFSGPVIPEFLGVIILLMTPPRVYRHLTMPPRAGVSVRG